MVETHAGHSGKLEIECAVNVISQFQGYQIVKNKPETQMREDVADLPWLQTSISLPRMHRRVALTALARLPSPHGSSCRGAQAACQSAQDCEPPTAPVSVLTNSPHDFRQTSIRN